jgi:hypothetical protein
VRRELPRHGTSRWHSPIVRAIFAAATDPVQAGVGVAEPRAGAFEWIRLTLDDLAYARAELAVVEDRMRAALDDLGLTALVTSIPGLSAVGAATILAETGDPARFSSAGSVGAVNNAALRAISSSCCADSPRVVRAAGTSPGSLTSASTSSVRTGVARDSTTL